MIVGIMAAAVIGVVWLQIGLIGTAIQVNQEKFENKVRTAISSVVDRLIHEEKATTLDYLGHGYVGNFFNRIDITPSSNQTALLDLSISRSIVQDKSQSIEIVRGQIKRGELRDPSLCSSCLRPKNEMYSKVRSIYTNEKLEDRINLNKLKEIIRRELEDEGLKTMYNYGIYSNQTKSFIIVNDYYVVPEENQPSFAQLKNSPFSIHLFRNEMPSPGLLYIDFPKQNSLVWGDLLPNLIGTLLFSALILFCFGYSVNVIFQQKKLSEMKTDFINNMTHEFKTPIATISLAADSITSPMISAKQEKVERFANIIKQENKRMNNQVEKVLQMAQIDRKEVSLKASQVNLHEIIARAVENIGLQVEKRNGVATASLKATRPIIEGDVTHISNVINNLLDNANKYSPDKPEISVSTRDVNQGVQVIVSDKGVGMGKESKKHIFDKFYRVHTGNLHDVKGFGLGLSYVKAIMDAHKGQIDVKSELGKGSSFMLTFPHKSRQNAPQKAGGWARFIPDFLLKNKTPKAKPKNHTYG